MAIVFGPTKWHPQDILIQTGTLGTSVAGGYLICRNGGVAWIVAPNTTEVSRNWYCRNDAVTTATNCTTVTGWFVPTCGQLLNPGYSCRTYWDSYSSAYYWSSTEFTSSIAFFVSFINGSGNDNDKSTTNCVRAMRCVAY